jgi:hypothetical protein
VPRPASSRRAGRGRGATRFGCPGSGVRWPEAGNHGPFSRNLLAALLRAEGQFLGVQPAFDPAQVVRGGLRPGVRRGLRGDPQMAAHLRWRGRLGALAVKIRALSFLGSSCG